MDHLLPDLAFEFALGRLAEERLAEVDAHLDGCVDCRLVLAEAVRSLRERATPLPGRQGGSTVGPLTRLAPGERLGDRYRIVRFIARGGMGEVYEAQDEMLGERIALKTLLSTISDDERAIRRLKYEANLARRVTHPNVCRIFDLEVSVGAGARAGQPPIYFLTMEFVTGVSLGARLRAGGRLPFAATRPLLLDLVSGMAAAHRVGVIHRDFKSDNVMLAAGREGGPDRVVIMDFGLAGVAEGRLSMRSSLDGPGPLGAVAGTVAYMAPEQLRGQPASVATDVYALGVVMFEMASGRLPFATQGDVEVATHRLVEPAPPVAAVEPGVDPRWAAVIDRCLARQPSARFASLDEVGAALAGPQPRGRLARTARGFGDGRSGRGRLGLAALVACALVAGAGAMSASAYYGARPERRTPRTTEAGAGRGAARSPEEGAVALATAQEKRAGAAEAGAGAPARGDGRAGDPSAGGRLGLGAASESRLARRPGGRRRVRADAAGADRAGRAELSSRSQPVGEELQLSTDGPPPEDYAAPGAPLARSPEPPLERDPPRDGPSSGAGSPAGVQPAQARPPGERRSLDPEDGLIPPGR